MPQVYEPPASETLFSFLQSSVKQFEKQVSNVIKERDQTRTDLSKSVLSRSRLENLCRELQRQNKEIKVEKKMSESLFTHEIFG